MNKFLKILELLNADEQLKDYIIQKDLSLKKFWETCDRPDWLIYVSANTGRVLSPTIRKCLTECIGLINHKFTDHREKEAFEFLCKYNSCIPHAGDDRMLEYHHKRLAQYQTDNKLSKALWYTTAKYHTLDVLLRLTLDKHYILELASTHAYCALSICRESGVKDYDKSASDLLRTLLPEPVFPNMGESFKNSRGV